MNTKKYIAIAAVLISIIVVLILFFNLYHKETDPIFTGGSGVSKPGYLVLTGYEEPSNDSSKIPLGKFLNTDQQAKIRSFLGALLFEKKPLSEYKGVIEPGSVNVDYKTSAINFKAKIEAPKITYTVNYNTVTDNMTVTNEKGTSLRPSHKPDGTPF
jgi:hypothetical protein